MIFPEANPIRKAVTTSPIKITKVPVSIFKLAVNEQMYMNRTIMPPTNKIIIVKNIQVKCIWAKIKPVSKDAPAKARAAVNGEVKLKRKPVINTNLTHKTINYNSYFYNYYYATTYLKLRVTDNMSLL